MFCGEKVANYDAKSIDYFILRVLEKAPEEKKTNKLNKKENRKQDDEQTLAVLSSVHRHSQAKCHL